MRREQDVSTICCPVTVRERLVLDALKAQLALHSDADVVRVALYRLAAASGDVDTALFRVRAGTKIRGLRLPR